MLTFSFARKWYGGKILNERHNTTPFIIFGYSGTFSSFSSVWRSGRAPSSIIVPTSGQYLCLKNEAAVYPEKLVIIYQNCVVSHHTRHILTFIAMRTQNLSVFLDSWLLLAQAVVSLDMLVPLKRVCSPSVCCIWPVWFYKYLLCRIVSFMFRPEKYSVRNSYWLIDTVFII